MARTNTTWSFYIVVDDQDEPRQETLDTNRAAAIETAISIVGLSWKILRDKGWRTERVILSVPDRKSKTR